MDQAYPLKVSFSAGESPFLLDRIASVKLPRDRSPPPQHAQSTYTAGEESQWWQAKPAMRQLRGEQTAE